MSAARRNALASLRFFALLATAALFGAFAPGGLAAHWEPLAALLALCCATLALSVMGVTFDLAVLAVAFAVYGWYAAAALAFLSHLAAYGTGRRYRFRERLLVAATRVPFFALAGLAAHVPSLTLAVALLWPLAYTAAYYRTLRTFAPWIAAAAQTLWAFAAAIVAARAGWPLGVAFLIPVPLLALALRALHQERLAAHRMALARDAVWNLLQDRDPGAQITSILESVHGDAPQETLQIYAALRSEDRPAPLASVGPWPEEDRLPLVRRALLELHAHNRESVTVRDDASVVTAYGVRADRLLGSLVVHRPAGVTPRVAARRYLQVARELAPLLRDVRSVVAAHNAASLDSLTGLSNRAAIMQALREQITHVRPGSGCAMLLLDVDNFKSVNDQLGHLAGDHCLRVVAQTIAHNIRSGDRAGRIGGEEFIVVMPATSPHLARAAGERLRAAIEASGVRHAGGQAVTASIGVAVAGIADTAETLIARADRALYQAKSAGRNRVVEISA